MVREKFQTFTGIAIHVSLVYQFYVLTLPVFPLSTVNYLKPFLVLPINVSWCWHRFLHQLPIYVIGGNTIFYWYCQYFLLELPTYFIGCNIFFYWYYQYFIVCVKVENLLVIPRHFYWQWRYIGITGNASGQFTVDNFNTGKVSTEYW